MRPIRRGSSPQTHDFGNYREAFKALKSRLGGYCSYCERRIQTQLAVEHVQPKAGPHAHAALEGRWENFLLACVNCNSTKGTKKVDLSQTLLPDRDNTFIAFNYTADGRVEPAAGLTGALTRMAAHTLSLTGLDKHGVEALDENQRAVALDRVAQRKEAWATASTAKRDVDANSSNSAIRRSTVRTAKATGFFSIWMTVFQGDTNMQRQLIDAFGRTRQSGCFFSTTSLPKSPAPNPDALPHGGKI